VPLIGTDLDVDIPLWVPDDDTTLTPVQALFISNANSTLTQMKRVLSRMRSQVLFIDKIEAQKNWTILDQKLRIIGETWCYLQLKIQRTGGTLAVPSNGNFVPQIVGAVTDARLVPQSEAHIGSTDTGRLAAGHILNSGEIKLDAINSGLDIHHNDVLTLCGPFPLDNWVDSEV
jgi:hypothetical protein